MSVDCQRFGGGETGQARVAEVSIIHACLFPLLLNDKNPFVFLFATTRAWTCARASAIGRPQRSLVVNATTSTGRMRQRGGGVFDDAARESGRGGAAAAARPWQRREGSVARSAYGWQRRGRSRRGPGVRRRTPRGYGTTWRSARPHHRCRVRGREGRGRGSVVRSANGWKRRGPVSAGPGCSSPNAERVRHDVEGATAACPGCCR